MQPPAPSPRTLQSLIAGLAAHGERRAVGLRRELGTRWWSYAELHRRSLAGAALLAARGVVAGDRIVLWAASSPEWVGLFFAAVLRGAVIVPLDADSPAEHVGAIARQVEARLLASDRAERDWAPLALPHLALAALSGPLPGDGAPPAPALAATAHLHPAHPADPVLIYYTSGSTAQPRGVVLTHENLVSQAARFRGLRPFLRVVPCRLLTLAPLSHVQGMLLGVCLPLSLGAATLYTHSPHPGHLIRAIRDDRITALATVPRALHTLGSALYRGPYGRRGTRTVAERLAGVRRRFLRRHYLFLATRAVFGWRFWVVIVGGAALPRQDEELWRDTGCVVVQGYGLTETAAIVSANRPLVGPTGSVGRPLAHQEVMLAPDGEILVRGPSVTPGYYRDPQANASAFVDGFLRTGDLGRLDHRGRLYLLGRKKDVVVTGEGWNVYPAEVESAFTDLPGLLDVVVCGRQRAGHEEVHAVLRLAPGCRPEEVVRAANARLHPHQGVRGWTVWEDGDFPRTSLLKVRTEEVGRRLRERSLAGPGAAAAPSVAAVAAAGDRGERLELLLAWLAAAGSAPGEQAGEGLRLIADLGLSSLDLVELLSRLEGRLEVPLHDWRLDADATVGELRRLAAEAGAAGVGAGGAGAAVAGAGAGAEAGVGAATGQAEAAAAGGADGTRARRPRRGGALPVLQPAWSDSPLGAVVRAAVRPIVVGAWARLCGRIVATWETDPRRLPRRFILAAAPHRHWLDAFVLCAALPRRLRRRLMFVTERDFHEHFSPGPGVPRNERLLLAAAYYALMPATFPFTIVPSFGSTRQGLQETCRLIERGLHPMTFPKGLFLFGSDPARHDPGMAAAALDCQVPILPVWLEGNCGLTFWPHQAPGRRPTITARFLAPVEPGLDEEPRHLAGRVEDAFRRADPSFFTPPPAPASAPPTPPEPENSPPPEIAPAPAIPPAPEIPERP